MAGLTDLIVPGGDVDAAEVVANFDALKSAVNGLRDESFEPGALNSRHFLDQASSPGSLPFKRMYRKEFSETAIVNTGYSEMVELSATNTASLYGEDGLVFVFAELEVYGTGASASPITVMSDTDKYELRLEFVQGTGAFTMGSWGTYLNATTRYITPGSAVAGVYAEIGTVILFGVAKVISSSTIFNARVTAGSLDYGGAAGGTGGRCKGAISALVVSR